MRLVPTLCVNAIKLRTTNLFLNKKIDCWTGLSVVSGMERSGFPETTLQIYIFDKRKL